MCRELESHFVIMLMYSGFSHFTVTNGALKELKFTPKKSYDKRIVIKWWKMVTLVHNPSLILERIQKRIKETERNKASLVVSTFDHKSELVVLLLLEILLLLLISY